MGFGQGPSLSDEDLAELLQPFVGQPPRISIRCPRCGVAMTKALVPTVFRSRSGPLLGPPFLFPDNSQIVVDEPDPFVLDDDSEIQKRWVVSMRRHGEFMRRFRVACPRKRCPGELTVTQRRLIPAWVRAARAGARTVDFSA